MKLIGLNIGIKIDNNKAIADFLIEENPDIICLQEVLRNFNENVFESYKSQESLVKSIGKSYDYSFFGPLWVADSFSKNGELYRDFGGKVEQGNEIISKFPISKAENKFFHRNYELFNDTTDWENTDHGRALQIVEFNIGGKRLQVLNLHGIWTRDKMGDERTIKEFRYILESAKKNDIATIITGDFNLLPETESIKVLESEFKNLIKVYGIKSTRPDFKDNLDTGNNVVDYIFVNDKIRVNDFSVIRNNISDHLPLVLDFDIIT
ncbi:MAG: endonuclease/exonuclease/phosphatase family protein [Candidatus Gracilibacteria bacterium]|nr:endonuclease/exonuclease/phosphatase family protein [Candidatus Gracilibacteria bacterium]